MSDLLQTIQKLQFSDKRQAETLLLNFIRDLFPLEVISLELRPQAISLNSFNGFLFLRNGKKLFFKTHTEDDNVVGEFYNASMLADAGYPIIQPIHSSTKAGQQLLIYEVIDDPSVFDVAWDIENDRASGDALEELTQAQNQSDKELFELYLNTVEAYSQTNNAPIHQLFYHRLTGGRLRRFYGTLEDNDTTQINLPYGTSYMRDIGQLKWVINGVKYQKNLKQIIDTAIEMLNPKHTTPSIVGHGDAHNGNVFFQGDGTLLYFDPAFAGRHSPLLDLVKPLFHNVFAMWMYYPDIKKQQFKFDLKHGDKQWVLDYEYDLPSIRSMFLESKVKNTLLPIAIELKKRDLLSASWREYMKSALFCCPFLTMNLSDKNKFPPEISLLGLAMSIQMGSEGEGGQPTLIDAVLDTIENSL